MKRWRDGGGFDDERERRQREEAARAPLVVQSLAPHGRGRRLVLPLAIGVVALMFAVATIGRYTAFFAASPSQTPAPPTPIAWLDATAAPVAPTPTPGESASPDASVPRAPAVDARIAYQSYLVAPGDTIHFVVQLTNTSGSTISLEPCPTYQMSVLGSTFPEPNRLLNCAAAPRMLGPGDGLSFQMTYTIPIDVAAGEQVLRWHLTSGLRGDTSTSLSIGGPPGAPAT